MAKRAITALFPLVVSICLLGSAWNGCEGIQEKNRDRFTTAKTPLGIVGGEETGYQEFKGVIFIVVNDGNVLRCTGTLIDPEVVVTAGHCVLRPESYVDVTNDPDLIDIEGGSEPNLVFYTTVEQVAKHPLWEGNSGDDPKADIAMLHLLNPVDQVEHYGVRKDPPIVNGEPAMLVGYGRPDTNGSSGVHRKGETTVLNKDLLSDAFEVGYPAGVCSGDSGGACLTQTKGGDWQLAGVISASAGCQADYGGMIINALTYYDWIDATMTDFVGYGLDGPDTDSETATDTDTDTDTDADTDSSEVDADDDDDNDNDDDDADAGENDKDGGKSGCGCRAAGDVGADSLAGTLLRTVLRV